MQRERDQLSHLYVEQLKQDLMMPVGEIGTAVGAAIFVLLFFWGIPQFTEANHLLGNQSNHLQSAAHIGPG